MFQDDYEAENINYIKHKRKMKGITESGYFVALGEDNQKGVFIDEQIAQLLNMPFEEYKGIIINSGAKKSKIDQGFIFETEEEVKQAVSALQVTLKMIKK